MISHEDSTQTEMSSNEFSRQDFDLPLGLIARMSLIDRANKGQISNEEAEAQANAAGLGSLATAPDYSKFDPMAQSRWTFVMAIAWIASRDMKLVAEQQEDLRKDWTHWVFRDLSLPTGGKKLFERREGWFLENCGPATVSRLIAEGSRLLYST